MTRLEELVQRLCDGHATPEEEDEVERSAAADEEVRKFYMALLDVEFTLRAERRAPDLAGRVMHRLAREREGRIVTGVMREVKHRLDPREAAASLVAAWWSRLGGVRLSLFAAATVALLAGGTAVLWRTGVIAPPAAEHSAGGAGALRVVSITGVATLELGREVLPLQRETVVPRGRIETGRASSAQLRRDDGAELVLGPGTTLAFGAASEEQQVEASELVLDRGGVDASLPHRRSSESAVAFRTPHAQVRIVGTRLRLDVAPRATRLAVLEGRVLFERFSDGSVVTVAAGQYAIAESARGSERAEPVEDASARQPAVGAGAVRVLSFDFEDGLLPSELELGQVVAGPPRPGGRSRFSAIGGVYPWGHGQTAVTWNASRGNAIRYRPTLVLTFDYHVGSDTECMVVQAWNHDRQRNYHLPFCNIVRDTWAHAVVRFADLVANPGLEGWLAAPQAEGDRIVNIFVMAGRPGGKPLYVDNLELLDYPPDAIPAESNARAEGR